MITFDLINKYSNEFLSNDWKSFVKENCKKEIKRAKFQGDLLCNNIIIYNDPMDMEATSIPYKFDGVEWNRSANSDPEWIYMLNRNGFMVDLAIAYRVTENKKYIEKLKSKEIKDYIFKNINNYYYGLKTDIHVSINNKLIMGIECKAYTENAMLKRILVDFTLLKNIFPNIKCVLLQLESQLTGDYSQPQKRIIYGSYSTHTLLSYFDIDLNIITLLEGERLVDKPIHKNKYYKVLKKDILKKSIKIIENLIKEYK